MLHRVSWVPSGEMKALCGECREGPLILTDRFLPLMGMAAWSKSDTNSDMLSIVYSSIEVADSTCGMLHAARGGLVLFCGTECQTCDTLLAGHLQKL